jgi:hypothetical protein
MNPQFQLQLLLPKPPQLENMVTDAQVLKSPIILFVKDTKYETRFIYWFGYSLGKIRHIFWGTYDRQKPSIDGVGKGPFKMQGICSFNELGSLNDTIDFKLKNGFKVIAQLTEDKISKTMTKYLGKEELKENVKILKNLGMSKAQIKEELKPQVNRMDFTNQKIDESRKAFYMDFAQKCLDYIEHNLVLTEQNVERKCSELTACSGQERFKNFGEKCDQFTWGIEQFRQDDQDADLDIT